MRVAHQVIAEASRIRSSCRASRPTKTWWMRQRVAEMGLGQWFHPTITVWRKGGLPTPAPLGGHVIQRGDMFQCDFGIGYTPSTPYARWCGRGRIRQVLKSHPSRTVRCMGVAPSDQSLTPHGQHRVDLRRPTSRDVTRNHVDERQQGADEQHGRGIPSTHTVQE